MSHSIYGLYWVSEVRMSTILIAIIALAFSRCFGAILGFASIRFKVKINPIVDQIDTILPQTQCGQCESYPGCRPYAEAIANGDKINKCPPGGKLRLKLADLMGVEVEDSAHDLDNKSKSRCLHS